MEHRDLMPGLPDEMALECLTRVPYDGFSIVRSVSKLWKHELESASFHHLRKISGLTRTVVALAQAESSPATASGKHDHPASPPVYRIVLWEPATGAWSSLPQIPGHQHGLPLFCQLAAVGRELVVVGGWDPRTWAASDEVHVYNFMSGTWLRGARVPGPRRSLFACAGSEERRMVFVAGGHDESKNALTSALAYDLTQDTWCPLPDMARPRDECRGLFIRKGGGGGIFRVVGGYATEAQGQFDGSAEGFDVAAWRWGPVQDGQLEDGTCPSTCASGSDGVMYMCRPDVQVVAMDSGSSEWRRVAELPGGLRTALQVVTSEEKVIVLGATTPGGAQVGYVAEEEIVGEGKKGKIAWKKVNIPTEYSGYVQRASCLEM